VFNFLSQFMKKDPQENCVHEWHVLSDERVYNDYTDEVEDGHAIFCPKCQGEMLVTEKAWNKIQKKMEINAQYYAQEIRRLQQDDYIL